MSRETVMMLLSTMDPEGTESRKKSKIKRRVYRSQVFEESALITCQVMILIT